MKLEYRNARLAKLPPLEGVTSVPPAQISTFAEPVIGKVTVTPRLP